MATLLGEKGICRSCIEDVPKACYCLMYVSVRASARVRARLMLMIG